MVYGIGAEVSIMTVQAQTTLIHMILELFIDDVLVGTSAAGSGSTASNLASGLNFNNLLIVTQCRNYINLSITADGTLDSGMTISSAGCFLSISFLHGCRMHAENGHAGPVMMAMVIIVILFIVVIINVGDVGVKAKATSTLTKPIIVMTQSVYIFISDNMTTLAFYSNLALLSAGSILDGNFFTLICSMLALRLVCTTTYALAAQILMTQCAIGNSFAIDLINFTAVAATINSLLVSILGTGCISGLSPTSAHRFMLTGISANGANTLIPLMTSCLFPSDGSLGQIEIRTAVLTNLIRFPETTLNAGRSYIAVTCRTICFVCTGSFADRAYTIYPLMSCGRYIGLTLTLVVFHLTVLTHIIPFVVALFCAGGFYKTGMTLIVIGLMVAFLLAGSALTCFPGMNIGADTTSSIALLASSGAISTVYPSMTCCLNLIFMDILTSRILAFLLTLASGSTGCGSIGRQFLKIMLTGFTALGTLATISIMVPSVLAFCTNNIGFFSLACLTDLLTSTVLGAGCSLDRFNLFKVMPLTSGMTLLAFSVLEAKDVNILPAVAGCLNGVGFYKFTLLTDFLTFTIFRAGSRLVGSLLFEFMLTECSAAFRITSIFGTFTNLLSVFCDCLPIMSVLPGRCRGSKRQRTDCHNQNQQCS